MNLTLVAVVLFLALGVAIAVLGLASRRPAVRWTAVVVGVVVALVPVGIVVLFVSTFGDPADDPDGDHAVGVRADSGRLVIWTGRCPDVEKVRVWLDRPASSDDLTWTWSAQDDPVTLETLRPPQPPAGMRAEVQQTQRVQLSQFQAVTVLIEAGEKRQGGVDLEPVVAESSDHPAQFWFGPDLGWRKPADVDRGRQLCG